MRLIDADAEITKIEEEIQRLRKAIERWQSRQLEGSTLYDTDEKIQELQNNITDCRMEIRILRSYTTAYDVQKVLDELERKIEFAGKMMVEKPSDKLDEIANNAAEDFILAYSEAIEIVKRGGTDEE